MIDYALLPPEINSARMYAGAGAAPMMAAAAAWDRVAAQWGSAAGSYRAVVSELVDGPWVGPASVSMAAAAGRYAAWMLAVAEATERTADQARAAAAAFERAFAATVPPWTVAANRAALALLVTTNFFGQNTPAIAANWAEYSEMWAQDAAAMHGYLVGSAEASTLTPFAAAPRTTSEPTISALNTFLADVAGAQGSVLNHPFLAESIQLFMAPLMTATGKSAMLGGAPGAAAAIGETASAGTVSSVWAAASGPTLTGSYGAGGSGVSAGVGRAVPIGGLSAPPSWAAVVHDVRLAAASSTPGAAASPAAPGGWLGGTPPVGGLVNPPAGEQPAARSSSGSKAVSRIARQAAAAERNGPSRWMPGATASDTLTESERNELDRLQQERAELAGECDAMARLMMAAMR